MTKQAVRKPLVRARVKRPQAKGTQGIIPAMLLAFGCGMGAAVLLLAVFAFLMDRFSLPVSLVRPLAMAAAWMGAAVSGYALASRLGHKKLLCGLGCGVFYGICLLLSGFAAAGTVCLADGMAALLAAVFLGGVIGGAVSALQKDGRRS